MSQNRPIPSNKSGAHSQGQPKNRSRRRPGNSPSAHHQSQLPKIVSSHVPSQSKPDTFQQSQPQPIQSWSHFVYTCCCLHMSTEAENPQESKQGILIQTITSNVCFLCCNIYGLTLSKMKIWKALYSLHKASKQAFLVKMVGALSNVGIFHFELGGIS
jgi:hypothetical protein